LLPRLNGPVAQESVVDSALLRSIFRPFKTSFLYTSCTHNRGEERATLLLGCPLSAWDPSKDDALRQVLKCVESGSETIIRKWHPQCKVPGRLNRPKTSHDVDAIPTLAWAARPDGSAEFLNRRWLDYTGLSVEEALDWRWANHPANRAPDPMIRGKR
jgi:hypothetical protein